MTTTVIAQSASVLKPDASLYTLPPVYHIMYHVILSYRRP